MLPRFPAISFRHVSCDFHYMLPWLLFSLAISQCCLQDTHSFHIFFSHKASNESPEPNCKVFFQFEHSSVRRWTLLEAVIGVKCPLASAGRRLGVQPVRRQHHEDEVGVELLLLFFHQSQLVGVGLHTCRGRTTEITGERRALHGQSGSRSRSPGPLSVPVQRRGRSFLLRSVLRPASAHPLWSLIAKAASISRETQPLDVLAPL